MKMKMKKLIDGLLILQKYDESADIDAEHDEIFVSSRIIKSDYSKEDIEALDGYGWRWSGANFWYFQTFQKRKKKIL